MARMRPTDVIWATLPLFVLVVAVRRWRRPRLLLALVAGLVAGAGEWIADALVHLVTAPGRAATVQRTTPPTVAGRAPRPSCTGSAYGRPVR